MHHPGDPSSLHKKSLRPIAVERRRLAHQAGGAFAAERIRAQLAAPPTGTAVAGYWPIGDEVDLRPLLAWLDRRGCRVALPVVAARGLPLEFRRWRPDDDLAPGPHGTWHPLAHAEAVTPALLLVPLLAFDRRGYRLGYGGGYYDRTLAALRARGPLEAVGIAYAAQEIDTVPHDAHDQPLDRVVTEAGVIIPAGRKR